ncbi:MAG TPA: ATP-binding cassette domain-containing protein [Phycisphaerae bacterium]|nr:ATP-binding cassette domain-containing protein [Phycisphaerae bacterium]
MSAVELENVTKTFGAHTAVDDLSLKVPPGCVYGFIGPNGSGKTTTLRMIMNIFYPDRGTVRVFGEPVHGACTDRIGYLPEERGLYKKMKVRDVLRFYGRLKSGRAVNGEVDAWLARMELSAWADKKVETLSKGMSQKVQFIATVVSRPEMVILDEPFSGLDPVNTEVLRDAVLDLQRGGTTVIFSTHDMATAERMCDFIFMIFKGRKVLDGTLSDIQDRYGSDTVRVRIDDDVAKLTGLPGVERINDHGRMQELRMRDGADPQQVLQELVQRGATVRHFELTRPSLHDIFVRIAGPEAQEATRA